MTDDTLQTRQAVTEAMLQAATRRLESIGERMHAVETAVTTNNLLAEEARNDRREIVSQVAALNEKVAPLAITVATQATHMMAHTQKCDAIERDQEKRHEIIEGKFEKVFDAIGDIRRLMFMGMGGLAVLSMLAPFLLKKIMG